MQKTKRAVSLLLLLLLLLSCFPLSAVMASAAETEETELLAEETIAGEAEEGTEKAPEETAETEETPAEPEENLMEEEDETVREDEDAELQEDILSSMHLSAVMPLADGGSSGSEIGGGGSGGNTAGSGSNNQRSVGVTMQVVYYRYDESYNRVKSHACVINTLENGTARAWNSTGKDSGKTETTVFDNYTISNNTFVVKSYLECGQCGKAHVYRFPTSGLSSDGCTFTWSQYDWDGFYQNGTRDNYKGIVHNDTNGSQKIEDYILRIILGSRFGAWDKTDIAESQTAANDASLYASTLRYLGVSEKAIQNYLDAYYGKLSIKDDGDVLVPTIIWAWVGAETLGSTNRIYTIGDVATTGSTNSNWLKTAYTSPAKTISGYGTCQWMNNSRDTFICKLLLGVQGTHTRATVGTDNHIDAIATDNGGSAMFGTGYVNRIQTSVDATAENGTNTFYYMRGYWTPYGAGSGDVTLTKTNTAGNKNLSGAEFTLYRDQECKNPVTAADYENPNTSDTGYVSASVRKTNSSGQAKWTGLYSGTYFLKETKAPEGYQVNVDTKGNVEVIEVAVGTSNTNVKVTNAENAKNVTLKKSINASTDCQAQLKGNDMYSLQGAEYQIKVNGTLKETLVTDANGQAVSKQQYAVGTVLAVKETKAPKGYKLDTKEVTYTVKADNNVIAVSDVPVFDPPFVLTKIDSVTESPQGNGSFAGAVFKWEYYDNNSWSGTPTRTWYFQTNAGGRCLYDSSYLAKGYTSDALYTSPAGTPNLPLGTIRITEVKNSLGYTVIPQPLMGSIVADSTKTGGAKHVWTAETTAMMKELLNGDFGVAEPINSDAFGELVIEKYDSTDAENSMTNGSMKGAVFQVINNSTNAVKIGDNPVAKPGEVCCEMTTDEHGRIESGKIFSVGKYTVKEIQAPEGYLVNEDWSQTFDVTETGGRFEYTHENGKGCPDEAFLGRVELRKHSTDGNPMEGVRFLMEYSVDEGKTWAAVTERDANTAAVPGTTLTETREDGSILTNEKGVAFYEGLRVRTSDGMLIRYRVTELSTNNGYTLAADTIWEGCLEERTDGGNDYEVILGIVNSPVLELPRTGGEGFVLPAVGSACLLLLLAGLCLARKKRSA